jgi:hypothetical protein
VLHVVEERDGVVVAAEQQDLAVEGDAFERRVLPERIVPGLGRER